MKKEGLFLMLLRHYKKPTMDREFAVFSELHSGVPTMDALVAPDEAQALELTRAHAAPPAACC